MRKGKAIARYNPSISTILKYHFYDDYSFTAVKSFDNNFDNATAYPAGQDVVPIATSKRTMGFSTGSLTRVLGTNTFLATTAYYDETGRLIQTQEENIQSGKDITTLQYHFDGRLLSSHSKHTTAGSGYTSFGILTKNIFDKIGRITSIEKKYGSNPFKTIAAYTLDDMGRLDTKQLSSGYTGSGKNDLESLTYRYNIHNNITGINKDYALKTPGKYTKWGNFFGLYLGYDNRDALFNTGRLDGTVTGLLWNTQGDDAQRKFDFTYDNAGRLTSANFKEKQTPGESWSNNKMDFSTTGTTGKITYDLHGNLQNMIQKGVLPGGTAPVNLDDFAYTYASLSNKLIKVTDNSTAGSANGKSGDFADGTNSGDDYVYDDNGNLIIDLNKNVTGVTGGVSTPLGTSGITYNFLDKPEFIRIAGKGIIQIVYDADGNKLQRKFTPEGGTVRTTTYINEFVYEEGFPPSPGGEGPGVRLSYIHFEEGRIRVMTAVSENNGYDGLAIDGNMDLPNGKRGAYDYFIRDYQQNVRMILTEQTHYGIHQATMEPERAGNEEPVFGQTGAGNEVALTRTAKPEAWQSNTSASASKLSALTHKAGPNVLLKVMAGDELSATTSYYYKDPVTNSTGNNLSATIITSLIQSILGSPATGLAKDNTVAISNELNANSGFLNKTAPDANDPTGNNPKAYLTVVFFNERFEFVEEGSTALRVAQSGDGTPELVLPNIKAPKNGYAYVYLSNENAEAVYFDNFKVAHTRGRIIEENHYYAFGLKIAGISSAKFGNEYEGSLKNEYLYNDKELWDDADLNWYDYGFRNYDPQIGRFPQLDPLTWDYPHYTPYQYAGNEPIANVDLDGLEEWNVLGAFDKPIGALANPVTLETVVVQGVKRASTTTAASASSKMFTDMMQVSMRSITQVGHLSSEQSLVKLYMQPFPPPFKEGPTISQGGNSYVSEAQKIQNAQNTFAAGFNPDGSEKFWKRTADNKIFNNFAENVVLSPAVDVAGGVTGIGAVRAGLRAGGLGMGKVVANGGLTNAQLVQKAATKAEAAIDGVGRFAGTAKHNYATSLLVRYQSIYGNRGLQFKVPFNNGPGNRGFLDVLDNTNGIIYDWKFGYPAMTPAQLNMTPQMLKYQRNFGLPTQVIKP